MSPARDLNARLGRIAPPAPTVLVVRPELLAAAKLPENRGATIFGTREASGDHRLLRAESLSPEGSLAELGVVAGGPAAPDRAELELVPGDPARATQHGAPLRIVVNDPARYHDRIVALPGAGRLAGKTALLVGLGSVGSDIGARLARVGIRVIGCDPDLLLVENLVRWGLPASLTRDIGRPKCHVWAEILNATVPGASVEGHALDVVRQGTAFDAIVSHDRPDLMIAATDTRDSRRVVNAAAAIHGVPALFVTLSDGASSVRIELVEDAGKGPCHLCGVLAEGSLDAGAARGPRSSMPYSATDAQPDSVAVPAMPADIAIATAMATRLALNVLAGVPARDYFRRGDQTGNVLFFSLRPDFWVFEDAWDRMVYQVERSIDCPTCGEQGGGDGR